MSNESADQKTFWERAVPWVVKVPLWAFYAWIAWLLWAPLWTAPKWAQSIAGGVVAVGVLAWMIFEALDKQRKQLNRIEMMLRRLPGNSPSA